MAIETIMQSMVDLDIKLKKNITHQPPDSLKFQTIIRLLIEQNRIASLLTFALSTNEKETHE